MVKRPPVAQYGFRQRFALYLNRPETQRRRQSPCLPPPRPRFSNRRIPGFRRPGERNMNHPMRRRIPAIAGRIALHNPEVLKKSHLDVITPNLRQAIRQCPLDGVRDPGGRLIYRCHNSPLKYPVYKPYYISPSLSRGRIKPGPPPTLLSARPPYATITTNAPTYPAALWPPFE